jgi:hypothetical protein
MAAHRHRCRHYWTSAEIIRLLVCGSDGLIRLIDMLRYGR